MSLKDQDPIQAAVRLVDAAWVKQEPRTEEERLQSKRRMMLDHAGLVFGEENGYAKSLRHLKDMQRAMCGLPVLPPESPTAEEVNKYFEPTEQQRIEESVKDQFCTCEYCGKTLRRTDEKCSTYKCKGKGIQ